MSKNNLPTIKDKEKVIMEWIDGKELETICSDHNITRNTLAKLLDSDIGKELRTATEAKYQALAVARENRMAEEVKNSVHEYILKAIKTYADQPDAIKYADKLSVIYNSVANNARLNRGEATERGESVNKNINIDVARLMEELKTPEEKKEFLLNQIKS